MVFLKQEFSIRTGGSRRCLEVSLYKIYESSGEESEMKNDFAAAKTSQSHHFPIHLISNSPVDSFQLTHSELKDESLSVIRHLKRRGVKADKLYTQATNKARCRGVIDY